MKAIIVEDEKKGVENLMVKLERHCPHVEIIAICYTGESAIKEIEAMEPDLVFLDIRLGSMSGFDVLDKLRHIHFELIFTTSYNQYAIKAIKESAVDYLLKPIKPEELETAVERARERIMTSKVVSRIAVPISNGFRFIPVNNISYCKADDNCTHIYRLDGSRVFVTRPLGDIERKLPADKFYRIHRSSLVNLDFVDAFKRIAGGLVVLQNDVELSVSRSRRDELLLRLNNSKNLQ
ncbi:MAG: LytTR family DNA-binding domain-containing protein [Saprospiraceae bacterium]